MDKSKQSNTHYLSLYENKVKAFFIIYFTVGLIGIITPYTNHLFIKLIPISLLLSFIAVLIYHQAYYSFKTILVFITIFLSGYFIEVIGVNTGAIFGHYTYGKGLGFKFLNTPLLIGINWVFLVYCSAAVIEKYSIHNSLKIIMGSLIMLIYDVILEQTAPLIDMWHWNGNIIPFQNYVAWFVISILFHSLIKLTGIKTRNPMAIIILICQFLFFLLIILINVVK